MVLNRSVSPIVMGEIDLFKNYSYFIGLCAKKTKQNKTKKKTINLLRNNCSKNVNVNIQ